MNAIIFDTETDAGTQGRVIEAAWIDAGTTPVQLDMPNASEFCQRYQPERPISLGAMAVHHIIDDDLVDAPSYKTFALPDSVQYLIGHNIDFDWQVIGMPATKQICTLALARKLWPQLEAYNQTALMYYFLSQREAQQLVKNAHNALHDVRMCKILLQHILSALSSRDHAPESWERLWILSEAARIPTHMPFGKHKGTAIADLPLDYIQWYLRQGETDTYLSKAFMKRL